MAAIDCLVERGRGWQEPLSLGAHQMFAYHPYLEGGCN